MTPAERRAGFRALARDLAGIDLDVYAAAGKDPLEPVLGEGDPLARVCLFGRDPGRHEVEHQRPFVGAGGQKIRAGLYRAVHGTDLPDFEASLAIGQLAFWANTVPYKPIGNKVWPVRVRASFAPLVRDLLVHGWRGSDVIILGRVAFDWFGHDRATRDALAAHWAREDRFEAPVEVRLAAPDGAARDLRLHVLPHPSPLNATWAPHFPGLLDACLARIGLSEATWRLPGPAANAPG